MMRIHNVCQSCGAVLDSGERCDCGGAGRRTEVRTPIPSAAKTVRRTGRKTEWKPKPGTEAYRIYQRGL